MEQYFTTQEIPRERWVDIAAAQLDSNPPKWWRAEGRIRRDGRVWAHYKQHLTSLFSPLLDEVSMIKQALNQTYNGRRNVEGFLLDTVRLYRWWRPQAPDDDIIQCMISQMPLGMQEFLENRYLPMVDETIKAATQYTLQRQTEPLVLSIRQPRPLPKPVMFKEVLLAHRNHHEIQLMRPRQPRTKCHLSNVTTVGIGAVFSRNCPQRHNRQATNNHTQRQTYEPSRNQCQGN